MGNVFSEDKRMHLTLETLAKQIAYNAHATQKRRGGEPYITHPARVVENFPDPEDEELRAVAWLHDVLEDTKTTAEMLTEKGIPQNVVEAVKALTKQKGEDYFAYLARVKENSISRRVKIADMQDNLSDDPTPKARERYQAGLRFLS